MRKTRTALAPPKLGGSGSQERRAVSDVGSMEGDIPAQPLEPRHEVAAEPCIKVRPDGREANGQLISNAKTKVPKTASEGDDDVSGVVQRDRKLENLAVLDGRHGASGRATSSYCATAAGVHSRLQRGIQGRSGAAWGVAAVAGWARPAECLVIAGEEGVTQAGVAMVLLGLVQDLFRLQINSTDGCFQACSCNIFV